MMLNDFMEKSNANLTHSHNYSQQRKEIRKLVLEAKKESGELDKVEAKHIEYGLGKGALIPKIYNRTIDKWKNNK